MIERGGLYRLHLSITLAYFFHHVFLKIVALHFNKTNDKKLVCYFYPQIGAWSNGSEIYIDRFKSLSLFSTKLIGMMAFM